MNSTVLLSTEREKDVGVIVSSDMKVSEQGSIAARQGNRILGLIRRNIAKAQIKRYRIAFCNATSIIIQPTKVQLVTGAVADSQIDQVRFHFSTSLGLGLDHL